MPEKGETKAASVPQYEEYCTGSCLESLAQWLGGLGLLVLGIQWFLWPEMLQAREEGWMMALSGLLFGIPTFRGLIRSRVNQQISRRNRRRYESYRDSLSGASTESNKCAPPD